MDTVRSRAELRTIGERGSIIDLWDQEIPSVSLRKEIYTGDRPQAIDNDFWAQKGNSYPSRCSWAVLLSAYSYEIKFKPTAEHANADGLSRLPLPVVMPEGQSPEATVFNIAQIERLPVTAAQIRQATHTDAVVCKVLQYTRQGWPVEVDSVFTPFKIRAQEFSIEDGCLLWGMRVVVPAELREHVLEELHDTHPGMNRMKAIARSHVWWPGIDKDVESIAKSCIPCLSVKPAPATAPLVWPPKPWQRIHVDFAGPFLNKMFFIIVDAHSKWPEVFEMTSTTSHSTIEVLRHVFAGHGLSLQLVSDNGPQFISTEFAQFLEGNGIRHYPMCHPQMGWRRGS